MKLLRDFIFLVRLRRIVNDLVLGICDFIHKTPRQSQLSLTWLSEPEAQVFNTIINIFWRQSRLTQ